MIHLLLLGLAGVGYLAATIRYQRSLYSEASVPGPGTLALAFGVHTLAMGVWGFELGRLPSRLPPETLALIAWVMVGMCLLLARAWKVEILGAFASPLATFMIIAALATAPGARGAAPAATDWLLGLHVAGVITGYAAFLLATVLALLYTVQAVVLKRKKLTGAFQKLPPLHRLDRATYGLIAIGFSALVVGIALGFVRAQAMGSRFWSVDVVLGLMTCIVYATYIHARLVGGWQGRKVNALLLVGFVFLIATYVGIGVLPWGVHQR